MQNYSITASFTNHFKDNVSFPHFRLYSLVFMSKLHLVTLVEDFDKTAILHIALDSVIACAARFQLFHAGSQVVISSHAVLLPHVDFHQVAGDTSELELLPPGWVGVGVNDFGFFGLISNCHLMKFRECKYKTIRWRITMHSQTQLVYFTVFYRYLKMTLTYVTLI